MRIQEEGKPVDAFITALYALAENCSLWMLHDELIRDRIVVGIPNSALSEMDAAITLDSAITQVRQSEGIKDNNNSLRKTAWWNPWNRDRETPIRKEGANCPKFGRKATHDLNTAQQGMRFAESAIREVTSIMYADHRSSQSIPKETDTGDTGDAFQERACGR